MSKTDWTGSLSIQYESSSDKGKGSCQHCFKTGNEPVRCCGCCCICEPGWYCGTGWRVLNNIIWLVVWCLAIISILLAALLWPTPDNVDFELLPGDQVVFCPTSDARNENTHISSRSVNCSANVTLFKGELKTFDKQVYESRIDIPDTWVSSKEYIYRSIYLAPKSSISLITFSSNQTNIKKEENKPHYALFKSREKFEKYKKSGKYATKEDTEFLGVMPNKDPAFYKVTELDEYIIVLESRARSSLLSADISIERYHYITSSENKPEMINTADDGKTVSLDGRCALLENKWTDVEDTCSVVVAVRYNVNDFSTFIIIASILLVLFVAHITSVIVVCCCAYISDYRRNAAKPDFFRNSYNYTPISSSYKEE